MEQEDQARMRQAEGIAAGWLHAVRALESYPEKIDDACTIGREHQISSSAKIRSVVVSGAGGSSMPGEFAQRFASVQTITNRGFHLPRHASQSYLHIVVSYSGETEEAISSYREGIARGLKTIVVTSGGRLLKLAQEARIPVLKMPSGYESRDVFGFLVMSVLSLLENNHLLDKTFSLDTSAIRSALDEVRIQCCHNSDDPKNPARSMAEELQQHVPRILGTDGNTDVVALRWKMQINENAQQESFCGVLPDYMHAEIGPALLRRKRPEMNPSYYVLLRNRYDHLEMSRLIELVAKILERRGIPYRVLDAPGETEMAQVLAQAYFGDYVSYFLAMLNGIARPIVPREELERIKAESTSPAGDS